MAVRETVQPMRSDFIRDWMNEYFGSPVKLTQERLGFGERAAVLVVDFQKDTRLEGLVARAATNTSILLSEARKRQIPIFYTVIGYRKDLKDFIPNKLGTMASHIIGTPNVEVLEQVKPKEEDIVIVKKGNSAFLGTDLLMLLNTLRVDTVIIAGCHTSGCIRATATDSYSLGFKTILPEECVGDSKGFNPHKVNLCDLHIRGADVITLSEVLDYFEDLQRLKEPLSRSKSAPLIPS